MPKPITHLDDEALNWLVKLTSGQVSAADEQAFFDWLHRSTAHQAAYVRAEQLWTHAAVIATVPLDSTAASTHHPSTSNPKPARKPPSKLLLGNWAIACCALVAVVTLGFLTRQPSSTHYHLTSALGEQRQISLEDGTQLVLNTDSQLEVDYSQDRRRARLVRGEAYFDVQPNPARPFDVETDFGMVRVLGTHFAVHRQATDTLVTVLEGRVALGQIPSAPDTFAALAELKPNQQLSLQQASQGLRPQAVNAKTALSWREKQLIFQKQPLARVVDELQRYYPIEINLAASALGEREITAVIYLGALDTTLAALCQPLKLSPQFSADRTRVTLAPQS